MTGNSDAFLAIGALLTRARDIDEATRAVVAYVKDPSDANGASLASCGISVDQAHDFLPLLPSDPSTLAGVCELGRAWALGRASTSAPPSWQPVVTSGEVDAEGIDRMTAETMIGLIVGACSTLRIFSPFLDARGLDVLAVAVTSATRRSVHTTVGYSRRGNRENAIEHLVQHVGTRGQRSHLRTIAIEDDRPFPHLKLIAADGARAYIGSANLTWPALTSNAEIGALVDGDPVHVLERWFDALIAAGSPPTPTVT